MDPSYGKYVKASVRKGIVPLILERFITAREVCVRVAVCARPRAYVPRGQKEARAGGGGCTEAKRMLGTFSSSCSPSVSCVEEVFSWRTDLPSHSALVH